MLLTAFIIIVIITFSEIRKLHFIFVIKYNCGGGTRRLVVYTNEKVFRNHEKKSVKKNVFINDDIIIVYYWLLKRLCRFCVMLRACWTTKTNVLTTGEWLRDFITMHLMYQIINYYRLHKWLLLCRAKSLFSEKVNIVQRFRIFHDDEKRRAEGCV